MKSDRSNMWQTSAHAMLTHVQVICWEPSAAPHMAAGKAKSLHGSNYWWETTPVMGRQEDHFLIEPYIHPSKQE